MMPSHFNEGTWLKEVGHSISLTAQMVRGLTSHAPIGQYRHRFRVGDQLEHCKHCSTPSQLVVEDFPHIYYSCRHYTRPPDLIPAKVSPLWDQFGPFILKNPQAFAFEDFNLSTTTDVTRTVPRWERKPSKPRAE